MKLNNVWKLVIGIATALITVLPLFFFIGWMSFMLIAVSSPGNVNSKTPDAFVYLFLALILTQILWNFLRMAMLAFYQAHAIMNEEGAKYLRISLSICNFLLPYISMPIYYFIYIYPENMPNWALEKPAQILEENLKLKTKTKKKVE